MYQEIVFGVFRFEVFALEIRAYQAGVLIDTVELDPSARSTGMLALSELLAFYGRRLADLEGENGVERMLRAISARMVGLEVRS